MKQARWNVMRGIRTLSVCVICHVAACGLALSMETPASYGEAAGVDTPILRVPYTEAAPVIDGTMAPQEWSDASSLSGFWYDYSEDSGGDFRFMASRHTMPVVYACYDKEYFYVCYVTPVYPEGSLLKCMGRFPDTVHHPTYGILNDDHIEFEMRPTEDNGMGFVWGLFKWVINPTNATSDQHWSLNGGEGYPWSSKALIRSTVTATAWTLEMRVPLESLLDGDYAQKSTDGTPRVRLPIADGTAYRAWFTRGIGGGCLYFNAFDQHVWNTTKTKLVFDSQAPSFQVNDLGPIMDDMIDVKVTIKNRNMRSESVRAQTVRVGFFVENEAGMNVYSSYDAPEMKDGLVELVPGETKELRLRKSFPGVSADGNVLWFDVRSAGTPAKVLFRTRLITFHSMNGGVASWPTGETDENGKGINQTGSFKERRLDRIQGMRPAKQDFLFTVNRSLYTNRLSAIIDKGLYAAPEEVKRATEAKLTILKVTEEDEEAVREEKQTFSGNFCIFLVDNLELEKGATYKVSVLLFDADKRIVGERTGSEFKHDVPVWVNNTIGKDDVVWEPFIDIKKTDTGFETLKHVFTVDPSGLPGQISIKPDGKREFPLEMRDGKKPVDDATMRWIGRGPQLRAPLRFEAVIGGKRVPATVTAPAKVVRQWKSEIEYASELAAGPVKFAVRTEYDCNGAMFCTFTYSAAEPVTVDALEMLMDVAGLVDIKLTSAGTATGNLGMSGADVSNCWVPEGKGVVWDSAQDKSARPDLFYSCFIPYFWFGSADRGWTFFCDSDRNWSLPMYGSAMAIERNDKGEASWRLKFFSKPATVKDAKDITFTILTHPQKSKPENAPWHAWNSWDTWCDQYRVNFFRRSDETLQAEAKHNPTTPPFQRYYQMGALYTPGWGRAGEDFFVHGFERVIRVGKRQGWWWDLTWPAVRSDNLAEGVAYVRNPADISKDAEELPYQGGFLTMNQYNTMKRLARVAKVNNVPLANSYWAGNSSSLFEGFGRDTIMTEGAGSDPTSYDCDMVTMWPASHWRYMAHANFSGFISGLACPAIMLKPGDEKHFDRQRYGRALLHNIGVQPVVHGRMMNLEICTRVLKYVADFGLWLDDGKTEYVPYWRNSEYVRFGTTPQPPNWGVYASVYRRPTADGKGMQALVIIMNEQEKKPASGALTLDLKRILGGTNAQTAQSVWSEQAIPEPFAAWWAGAIKDRGTGPVLRDLDSGQVVPEVSAGVYGPVHVPWHDFRAFYVRGGAQ